MDEKYKQFLEYNWVDSKEWQLYYSNLFPTPPPSKILRYKKKFYRNKIDQNFDIDYQPPQSEEKTSTSSNETQYSNSTQSNYSNQTNQQSFSNEQTFETYRAAQSLARPINSNGLLLIETFLLTLFIFSLPIRYKTNLVSIIAFLIRTIRLVGIPQFNMTYLQAALMNDACHTLLFSVQIVIERFNYYLIFPVIISAVIALSDNIRSFNAKLPLAQQYIDLINNKKEEIIQTRSHVEVAIGFVSIIGIFLKLNSFLTPIIYWQMVRVKYTLNPYIKQSFKEINQFANDVKNNEKCPGIVKTIIDKVQWAVDYMGKMYSPQQNAQSQEQNQGQGGSMCNIF